MRRMQNVSYEWGYILYVTLNYFSNLKTYSFYVILLTVALNDEGGLMLKV